MDQEGAQGAGTELITEIVLEVFRLNGLLVEEGDRLTADLDLTSARWKVLGAIALGERALTVAQIARRMGLTRQSVQRVVKDLERSGHVRLIANPDHQRAPLVERTARGLEAYDVMMQRQAEWARGLAADLAPDELQCSLSVLRRIAGRLAGRTPVAAEEAPD